MTCIENGNERLSVARERQRRRDSIVTKGRAEPVDVKRSPCINVCVCDGVREQEAGSHASVYSSPEWESLNRFELKSSTRSECRYVKLRRTRGAFVPPLSYLTISRVACTFVEWSIAPQVHFAAPA